MRKRINALIFGHSHVWSIKRALESKLFIPQNENFCPKILLCGTRKFPGPLTYDVGGVAMLNSALVATLSDYPCGGDLEDTWLISAVQGNYYNIVGMINGGLPFDFVLPDRDDLGVDAEAMLVPYDAIYAQIEGSARELVAFYARLTRMGYSGIIHLGAPPPHPDSRTMRDLFKEDRSFSGRDISISSARTRLKLWLTQEKVLAQVCSAAGIQYVSAPERARDEGGLLQINLCKDPVHGTAEYARLVLEDVEALLSVKNE